MFLRGKLFFRERLERCKEVIFFKIGEEFLNNSIVRYLSLITLAINGLAWGAVVIFVKPVDFPVILHYNVYFGVDVMGNWWLIFLLPLLGLSLSGLNFSLSAYFYRKKERIASYLLLLSALMVQACILVATTGLTIINY